MHQLYLSLGSNLGNRETQLAEALRLIGQTIGTVERVSTVIETPAWGYTSPNPFLNLCCLVRTEHEPLQCLRLTQDIERRLGRTRKTTAQTYEDRLIDIDLLTYDNLTLNTPELTLPHPHMWQRAFVSIPLREIT